MTKRCEVNLKEYLFYTNVSVKDFAKEIGVSNSYLSGILAGKKKPSIHLLAYIEQKTHGKVKIENISKPTRLPPEFK